MTRPQEGMADIGWEKKITVENKFKKLRGQDVRRIIYKAILIRINTESNYKPGTKNHQKMRKDDLSK